MSLPKDGAYNWKLAYSRLSGLCENTNVDPDIFIYKEYSYAYVHTYTYTHFQKKLLCLQAAVKLDY